MSDARVLVAGASVAGPALAQAGFAGYEGQMRPFVEANQEIGRLHARSREVPGPDVQPGTGPDVEWDLELIDRAINGMELPDYAGLPDSGATPGPPITSSASP